jgi:hypothetical protein
MNELIEQLRVWVRQNPEANAGDHAGEELLTIVRRIAALDQSSPSPLQAPHNPGERLRSSDVAVGEGETPPLCEDEGCPNAGTLHVCINRQENDDVFPGFRGNNDHS